MFDYIYIEEEVKQDPRVLSVLKKYPQAHQIVCYRYGEIFNKKNQNFRIQKQHPHLILAKKFGDLIWPVPKGFGIGSDFNYYFSHFLNCPFDCRYCFLQGLFSSAHYVWFVNFEDFQLKIKELVQQHPDKSFTFFSGYDGDSLAMESLTSFGKTFVEFFRFLPQKCILELRTKSSAIQSLLKTTSHPQCVVAYSLTPSLIQKTIEHKTASISTRIEALVKLGRAGWRLGLRFDPLIYTPDFEILYRELFEQVLSQIDEAWIHSVTIGPLRLASAHYQKIVKLYPQDPLFALGMKSQGNYVSYGTSYEQRMKTFCLEFLSQRIQREKIFVFDFDS